ncbi:MAG: hypothetical protein ACREQ2_21335 [Candidatus Binatia bacterium]
MAAIRLIDRPTRLSDGGTETEEIGYPIGATRFETILIGLPEQTRRLT